MSVPSCDDPVNNCAHARLQGVVNGVKPVPCIESSGVEMTNTGIIFDDT